MSLAAAMTVEVRAYARLHFGLLEICPGQPHCYGGVGVMIDTPVSRIRGRVGHTPYGEPLPIEADVYWAPRVEAAIEAWYRHRGPGDLPLQSIEVVAPPLAHVGLGSGTQFACSVAALLSAAVRALPVQHLPGPRTMLPNQVSSVRDLYPNTDAMASDSGRGKRSYIGLEGFRSGGLIVDLGNAPDRKGDAMDHPPSRTVAHAFPSAWRIVTACDRSYVGDYGPAEAAIFERCASQPNPHRDAMLRAVELDLLPALAALDWPLASQAIGRYGAMAGEIFRPLQGGIYRSPSIATAVASLQSRGVHGVGQSSWGPTLFAIARDDDQAQWIADHLRATMTDGTRTRVASAAGGATYGLGLGFTD